MNRFTSIIIGAGLLAMTSLANAAGELAPVTVNQNALSAADCTPPNGAKACSEFHAAIRKNFSAREIGLLFGAATAYQEYPASNDRVRARYAEFLRNAEENGVAVAVAEK
jgi:hypothetical protein